MDNKPTQNDQACWVSSSVWRLQAPALAGNCVLIWMKLFLSKSRQTEAVCVSVIKTVGGAGRRRADMSGLEEVSSIILPVFTFLHNIIKSYFCYYRHVLWCITVQFQAEFKLFQIIQIRGDVQYKGRHARGVIWGTLLWGCASSTFREILHFNVK